MKFPSISICIPAYKNTAYLEVLLRSIEIQTFKDIEVVVTDDSPNDEVMILCKKYEDKFPLVYQKNVPAKGSPTNWNEGIRLAKGKWIKIMHDDDWFVHEKALQLFYESTVQFPNVDFFYSAYNNVQQATGSIEKVTNGIFGRILLKLSPLNLFSKNRVGNPSCTLIKNFKGLQFDERLKWVVDFDFYMTQFLKGTSYQYIPAVLINVGIGVEQITNDCLRNPAVEIPENFILIEKYGSRIFNNILVFDYYWRLLRNCDIRSREDIALYYRNDDLNKVMEMMLLKQMSVRLTTLKKPIISKLLMLRCYVQYMIKGA